MLNKRKTLIAFFFITAILILSIAFLSYKTALLQKEVARLEGLKKELSDNGAYYAVMAQSVKIMQKRMEEGRNKNFITEVERITSELNIGKNFKKSNTVGSKKEGALNIKRYELRFEGLDINTVVNLLYRLLNAPLLVRIENCNLSVSFDNPNLFILTITVAHIT